LVTYNLLLLQSLFLSLLLLLVLYLINYHIIHSFSLSGHVSALYALFLIDTYQLPDSYVNY